MSERSRPLRTKAVATALALLCTLNWATATTGQQPPPISREEFEYQLAKLDLDAQQVATAETIYGRLVEQHGDAYEALLAFHNWRDYDALNGDDVWNRDIDRSSEMVDAEKERLIHQYFADLRESFPERADQVGWLGRAHLRFRNLKQPGEEWGSAPDLIALLESIDQGGQLRANPNLTDALDHYDREMDGVLRRAVKAFRLRRQDTEPLVEAGNLKGLTTYYVNFWTPQAEMWELSKQFIPLISAHMARNEATAFEAKAVAMLYGDIYEPTRIDILLTDALARDDLSEDQLLALQRLANSLESQRARRRQEVIALADRYQSVDMARLRCERFAARRLNPELAPWPAEDEEYREAVRTYREIGSDLEQQLAAILEQRTSR